MELLQLYDKNKNKKAGLTEYKDLCIESVLTTGDKKLSFSYSKEAKYYDEIVEEGYIRTKTQEYVIKARDIGVDYTRFDCVLNLEELEANIFDRFESVEQTITASLNLAIVGTGWTVKANTLKKKRTVRCTNKNALEIVQEIKKTYRVDIVFNTLKREIEVYEHLGEDKGTYFIDSLNLTALQVQSDSYKFATRIIAEGKDGLTFSSINNGKNYVENYQYSNKIKTIYWKDERYTVKESLLEDAKAKLEELSKPFTSYNASILNLAELNPKYKSILDYSLGDTITLLSKSNKVKDKQRIVKTIEWPQDHTKDTVELANATLKFEDIQQENQETTDTVNNITSDNGTLDSNAIEDNSIEIKKIDNFEANVLKVTKLDVINANIENLHANKADIQDLNVVKATVGQLEATKANITQLNATNAEISKLDTLKANIVDLNSATAKIGVLEAKTTSIDNLLSQKADIKDLNALNANISNALIKKANVAELEAMEAKTNKLIANKADISDLNAANANINSIKADTADIKTLINGNLSSENIQTGGITSDKLTISDGFIKDAMIANVSASKITAGTIDAAKINVVNLNADNLTVGKINGQLLKDGSISGLAIENGAIDNNKVSPNANIEASKININSVVTAINAGSTLLTANKVSIDSEKGTLDVAFNKLNTSLEANKKVTESNSTAINVVQGKLSASIENSKILEGKQKTLEDNYNRTVVTVDSLKNTIGQQKTLIDSATGKITSVEVKANTLEKNLNGLTQTVTDTKKVIENNKTILESKNAELKADIDSVSSSLSSVSSTVDKNNKTLVAKTNTLEQNLNGLTQTVESNKTVTDGKITSVESETHELKAGLGGLTSKLDTLKSTTDGINKTVSNQGSAINQLKDSIKLKVDSSTFTQSTQTINSNINKAKEDAINTANNAINNLQISTRNLAKNSNFKFGWRDWGFNNPNNNAIAKVIKDNILESCVKVTTYTSNQGVYAILKRKPKTTYSWSVMLKADKPCKLNMVHERGEGSEIINLTTEWTKFTGTGIWNGDGGALCFYSNGNNPEITYYLTNLIYVEGDKVGDWTPAPEDLQAYADEVAKAKADLAQANAIANSDGKITEEERKRIQQAQENLNTAIAKATEAETKAKSYADTKKQEAINAASTDATNKANNALNNAKAYTNTEITTVNTHLNKATAEINILKEKIESKVSQSDIDKSISEIKLGDRNLITKDINNLKTWNIVAFPERIEIINNKYDNILNFKNTSSGWEVLYKAINVNPNKYYVLSFDYSVFKNYYCLDHYKFKLEISTSIPDNNVTKNVIAYHEIENIQTELKRVSLKFKPLVNTIYLVLNGGYLSDNQSNIKFNFNKFKLIEGNKTTDDWTPAPEDTDQLIIDNIKTVTDKITTVESKLTQENNSIKASVQDLNSTTQSITTNVSNINRDLTNKINSNLDAAKSFATDIATNKANTAKQEAINTANSNTTNVINNLQIGDRNLAFKTDSESVQVGNNTVNQTQSMYGLNIEELKGKKITISFDWSVDGENISGTFYTQLNNTPWTNFTDTVTVSNSNKKGHITKTINMPNEISATSIMCRKDNFVGTLKIRKLKIVIGNKIGDWSPAPEDLQAYADEVAKAKSELAKQQAIADSDGKITEEERKRIQQAQENLNTAIARADKAKQDAINAASVDATNKTNNALNSAKAYVNAEITTVNTKVSNVESNLNILKDKINTKVSQSDIDKSISNIQLGGRNYVRYSDFSSLVPATNNIKGWNVWGDISVFFNQGKPNYNVNGVVYLAAIKGGGIWQEISSDLIKPNEDYTLSLLLGQEVNVRDCPCYIEFWNNDVKVKAIWLFGNTGYLDLKRRSYTFKTINEPYTSIRLVFVHNGSPNGNGCLLQVGLIKLEKGNKAGDWTIATEDTDSLIADNIKVVDTKISDVSSNVTQLRDSVTTQINSINSKTQSIETTLGSKASKQEVTEVNNRVATIKASLDSITQRVSSTESKTNSLETNINGKASKQELTVVNNKVTEVTASLNGITQRVGNTESRINALDGKVAGAVTLQQFTEFKQSNDKFKFTVEQRSSVSNILPNSSFHGGDRGWFHGGVEFWAGAYSGYGFKGRITGAIKNRAAYNNPERYLQTHKAYKVKKNTTYTINFHYICEKNVQSMDAFVVLSDTEHGDYAQPICVLTAQGGSQSNAAEEKPFTYKFNTGNHEWVWIRFDHNGMKSGVNWDEFCWIYVSEIGIYEGDVGAVKWTPKGGEVYSANYQMDGLGFKGTFEDGTYASLGKDGLEWYNAGTGHAYHALTYVTSFDIPIGNPGKAYIKLPAEFTKRRSSLKWTVALRGYYYNTTGNFFPFHVHCTGAKDYIENGLVVCEVQGLCKIQNGSNSGDVQFRPLTAMLIAIA
ncbi:MAG: phage tail spike protein [Clostridium perfringens]|nr:phage tail spike protein [Clostridium perfringens]